MPMLKEPKKVQPLWKENDYKAQKKGVRNTVYSVNGDQFTGEWLNNLKDGEHANMFSNLFMPIRYFYFFISVSQCHDLPKKRTPGQLEIRCKI